MRLVPRLHEPTFLAFALSAFFLTIFSYLILLLYYTQAKKPEQLEELVQRFKDTCSSSLRLFPDSSNPHLAVAEALFKLSQYLAEEEWQLFPLNDRFPVASRFLARCQSRFAWKDIFHFKQLLLRVAIQEYLHQIRLTPTDLELHASLASAYVALSQIYKSPEELDASKHQLAFYKRHASQMQEKFQLYGKLALEEFQILNHYAPNDPWIHEQLASGYHALGLNQEETREVEFLRKLRPNDGDIAFRLGALYFKQGLNAKGLQIYEELKKSSFAGADLLMGAYGKIGDT